MTNPTSNPSRRYLLDREHRFNDLGEKDAGLRLDHQLDTIINSFNRYVFDTDQRIEQVVTQVGEEPAVAPDSGNPSGATGLTIVLTADDPTLPETEMAFSLNRDLINWQTIFAVEVALRAYTPWAKSVARNPWDYVCNTAGTMVFLCTGATTPGSTSGLTEPTWNTAMGSETMDSSVHWRRVVPPPAHGPYALQRAYHTTDVLASGSGIAVVADEIVINLNMPSPPADGTFNDKVILLFASELVPDMWYGNHGYSVGDKVVDSNNNIQECTIAGTSGVADSVVWNAIVGGTTTDNSVTWTNRGPANDALDGNIIQAQVGNTLTIFPDHRFVRTATLNWVVVEPWWDLNSWEHTFWIPNDLKGGILSNKVWRLASVPKYSGKVVAADVYSRNLYGVSQ
ncbi:MAG TPA: hypothetical protein DGH68_04025 [Bacteroidetes bacterium]|nr:hypothetical protein [Bacteroidota bacterium]